MTEGGGVRLALVGANGRIAKILSDMGALAAVCDPDEQRAASCGQEYSVSHYGDVGGMIRGEAFDGAVVAASADARATAASELLGAGKHACVQWPPACDAAGVGALLELAGRNKKKEEGVLSCLPVARPCMASEAIRDAASSGAYGRLMSFDIRARGSPASAYADRDGCDYGDGRDGSGDDDHADDNHAGDNHAGDARARAMRAMQADAVYAANLAFDAAPHVVFAVSGGLKEDGRPEGRLTTILGYGGGSAATISINLETNASGSETAEAVLEGAAIKADLSGGSVTTEPATAGSGPGRAEKSRSPPRDNLSLDLHLRSHLGDFADAINRGDEPERRGRAARGAIHALAAIKAAKASLLSARRGVPIYLDLR